MTALNRKAFEDYLRAKGYSEWTPKGRRSTVYDYPFRIDSICKDEGYVYADGTPNWDALLIDIETLVEDYDKNGVKESLGAKSDNAPRNALKRLNEFVAENSNHPNHKKGDMEKSSAKDDSFDVLGKKSVGDDNALAVSAELDRLTVKVIIEKLANSNSTITYGELAKKVGDLRERTMSAQGFASTLGRIQDYCKELGLPSLSVLAVDQNRVPAPGFVAHYRSIHPDIDLTDSEIIRKERFACINHKDWQPLYEKVGLSEKAPNIRNLMKERESQERYEEGKRVTGVLRTEVKRNPAARARCLELKGYRCMICEKDLEEVYGVHGIIHVHHLKPIFETAGAHEVNPERDLIPVCPNCHAVIHSKGNSESDCYSPNEVREMLGLSPLEQY